MSAPLPFHPAVDAWFRSTFAAPTAAQTQAWPAIQSGKDVLIAAPTGSGKTLAAFLAAIDELVCEGERWGLPDETRIVYVSPLKSLSNDIHRNLEAPLSGIRARLLEARSGNASRTRGPGDVEIRTWVRTGDTPQHERARMRRKPPHILVTTPESLYILLGSQSGRDMLATTRSVIIDEIHAVAGNKRGSHLSLSLERLDALTGRRPTRIGLSATQQPIEEMARFLVGTKHIAQGNADCRIIDSGHARHRDLALELPASPLEAVMSGEAWTQVYDRLAQLIREHRTTLIFVNTRRLAERVCRHVSERVDAWHAAGADAADATLADISDVGSTDADAGADTEARCTPSGARARKRSLRPSLVAAHHGSLARELRFDAEQRLKRGELKALVATASMELGIDIGEVDLVCQLGSPRSINAFLQRVGRSGHAVGGTPKGRLFPLSRDDLAECTALLDSIRRGELDRLKLPLQPLDVLAQQIVAEAAARECREDELHELLRGAYPFRALTRESFDEIVRMLAEGFTTRRGRRGALLHHDAVNHLLRGRKGARLTAITSGGAIADTADYQVMLEPEGHVVGSVNEDFAVESLTGDVFQLGNAAYRILRIERGTVRVEDARGETPSIPFWLGEAPGRTDELSAAVSRLRSDIAAYRHDEPAALDHLVNTVGIDTAAAAQLLAYYTAAQAALGCLPTQRIIVFERFFDEAGGMQLVIHSPFGGRINRAWGLALRKRFCRTFNFELQAAATEDTIILSLTTAHSFELQDVARFLRPDSARDILVQALLASPMFTTRWRRNAAIALALPRFRGGRKVPPQLARMNAEDLLAAVFPDQLACGENLTGDIVVPDHPLVRQAVRDCLEEAMDIEGFERLLSALVKGELRIEARDLTEPSPLALEVLSARPYAFLDDVPLEERRTQAVLARRWLDPESATDIGKLDSAAIARVRAEAWPDAASADELHDALLWFMFLSEAEVRRMPAWPALMHELMTRRRACRLHTDAGVSYIATERIPMLRALLPGARIEAAHAAPSTHEPGTHEPGICEPAAHEKAWSSEDALRELVRGRLEGLGPVSADAVAPALDLPARHIDAALLALEAEGTAMRGRFEPGGTQWCDRRLLARIHRYTVKRLRAEIEPVQARDFLRFLFDWQHVTPDSGMQGPDAVPAVLAQLEGFEVPAGAWETEVLPARIAGYEPAWLDEQCLAGRIVWARLASRAGDAGRGAAPVRSTPIALLSRRHVRYWTVFTDPPHSGYLKSGHLTSKAQQVAAFIQAHGASFFDEIAEGVPLLPNQVKDALAELVALGLMNSDGFGGLRALLLPADRRRPAARGTRRRSMAIFGMQDAGRWAWVRKASGGQPPEPDSSGRVPTGRSAQRHPGTEAIEYLCHGLLRRWGVVFWKLLEREAGWLPPWRDLLHCLRRLEARGEIRGGRFVAGFSGEQFALPEAVGALREVRRRPMRDQFVSLSAADPLNLIGILTPGGRLASITGNRLLYRDGLPVALQAGGEIRFLESMDEKTQWQTRNLLLRRPAPAPLAGLA
ncbi:ATP-dependent DNA helicase [Steroidobacter denitrificans]|uniref:ATP-dependent DNA helicase n=1 Tax=Steroidobacter denitrificans TaxID=465721 RepID=A0A127FEG4_STEDE|nr:DEAD/DEAH box helicase [Steroidobacter denitrificans]AMN48258.1 ATP-dependent DNA helicase [Steroidobacter denitrificans]